LRKSREKKKEPQLQEEKKEKFAELQRTIG
jgi:hypothetical protein